jgi:amidase
MSFREYASYDGLGLAELVAKGEVTASELVEEAIARIEKHNPVLNAVIHKTYETARKVAGDPPAAGQQGMFQGVPFLLKDILGDCKGVPTTSACRFFTGLTAPFDSELVVRYPPRSRSSTVRVGTPGIPSIRRAARAADRRRRWPPASCRSPTRTTAVARFEFPRPAAGWWA